MSIPNRIQNSVTDILAASLIAALVVVTPAPLLAQQSIAPQKAANAVTQNEEENEAPAAKKPGQEGIKIHGHWIIDVKNADGTLAEHRDFQNSLNGDGPYQLSRTLLGIFTPEYFSMYLYTTGSTIFQISVSGSSLSRSACYTPGGYLCSTGLTQGLTPYSGNNVYAQNSILLSAQVTPTTAVSIASVGTALTYCGEGSTNQLSYATSTASPAVCKAGTGPTTSQYASSNFTGTTLSTPLAVAAGQSVSVTVTFSFS